MIDMLLVALMQAGASLAPLVGHPATSQGTEAVAQAAPSSPEAPPAELPPEALRNPYGYVLSQCSPLVLPAGSDPSVCEARAWAAIQVSHPEIGPRPGGAAPGDGDPVAAETGLLGGRCRARATPGETGGMVICGPRNRAAEEMLERLLH